MQSWLKKNDWYDPQARDTDSRIAKVIDQELAADGWDPADPEYWDELDNRLSARFPHRYASKGGNTQRRSAGPTASSRTSNPAGAKPGTITLSRERVQAIKDAGAWDDTERRNKMIRAYASYDRQQQRIIKMANTRIKRDLDDRLADRVQEVIERSMNS